MVKVKYFGFLNKKLPYEFDEEGFCSMDLEGKSVGDLLEQTNVDPNMRMTILVNSHRENKEYIFKDGDLITVMPLVSGG